MSRSWCAVLLLVSQAALGQEALLRIETNDPAAHVFADTTWLGTAVRGPFGVAAGHWTVRVVPSALGTWSVPSRSFEVDAHPGDTLTIEARFPYVYRLESSPPSDASLEGPDGVAAIGSTPVLYRAADRPEGVFRFQRDGYVPALVSPGSDLWNLHTVTLEPSGARAGAPEGIIVEKARGPRRWIDFAALGVSVAAGVVAVHYKRRADRLYDEYRETGDPTLRPSIDRYDRFSAVALGTMQVGVGVFAIRLALR